MANDDKLYSIPARFRRMENMHIIFWLLKDIAWCMLWRPLGIVMVVPTLLIAILIAWRTRQLRSELAHNLAITFWISANAYWMISEFYGFDEAPIWHGYGARYLALIPFTAGVFTLAWYYLIGRHKPDAALHPAAF